MPQLVSSRESFSAANPGNAFFYERQSVSYFSKGRTVLARADKIDFTNRGSDREGPASLPLRSRLLR